MYVLATKDSNKVVLAASIDTRDNEVSFGILDLTGSFCKDGSIHAPETFPPYEINGKYIRILPMCVSVSRLITPETQEGRRFLQDQVMSGNVISIQPNLGPILHFKGAFPSDMLKKLKNAANAM